MLKETPMDPRIPDLRERLARMPRGTLAELARRMRVPQNNISRALTRDRLERGEATIRMIEAELWKLEKERHEAIHTIPSYRGRDA